MKVGAALVKLIIFAVVTLMLTALLGVTISNRTFVGTFSYKAKISDATSLIKGDDVRIAGVRVGSVESVKVVDDRYALVSFNVRKDIRLETSTIFTLRYRNLVGQRYVQLSEGPSSGRPLRPGSTLPMEQTHPALDLTTLFNGFRPLFVALSPDQVNKLSYEIIQVLQGEGGTITSLLRSTASLTNTLADRDAVIGRVVRNLNDVMATIDRNDEGLSRLLISLQRLVTGLAADRRPILDSLDNIADLTTSTSSLLSQIRPPISQDLDNLSRVTKTLNTTKHPDGQNVLDEYLRRVPQKLNAINRTASYGSWFNFYLCEFDVLDDPSTPYDERQLFHGSVDTPSCHGASK